MVSLWTGDQGTPPCDLTSSPHSGLTLSPNSVPHHSSIPRLLQVLVFVDILQSFKVNSMAVLHSLLLYLNSFSVSGICSAIHLAENKPVMKVYHSDD